MAFIFGIFGDFWIQVVFSCFSNGNCMELFFFFFKLLGKTGKIFLRGNLGFAMIEGPFCCSGKTCCFLFSLCRKKFIANCVRMGMKRIQWCSPKHGVKGSQCSQWRQGSQCTYLR